MRVLTGHAGPVFAPHLPPASVVAQWKDNRERAFDKWKECRKGTGVLARSRGGGKHHRNAQGGQDLDPWAGLRLCRSCSRSVSSRSRSYARSPSIPRRKGSPSFLDKRRITR